MRAVLLLLFLALAGCSANNDALLPLPTPLHVRYASQVAPECREGCPGVVLEAAAPVCTFIVAEPKAAGTMLRVQLKGLAEYDDPVCPGAGTPARVALHLDTFSPQPQTLELVWKGRVDRYRMETGRLVPVDTSFTTTRPWGV